MSKLLAGIALTALLAPSAASAATYNFEMTYNGDTLTLDAGSDVPAGTILDAAGGYVLNVSASGDEFWRVNSSSYINDSVPLDFMLEQNGTRTANATSTFFLDGLQVEQIVETGVTQQFAHAGAQVWTLAQNLEFDSVVLAYTMTSGPAGTIRDTTNLGLFDSPGLPQFFEEPRIDYVSGAAAIPLPASALLYLTGLAGAMVVGGRSRSSRRRAAAL